MDISVIIVTYNSADCIAACLDSLRAQTSCTREIVVVDNASKDDTLARLKNYDVRVIASPENLGFGRGCNLGFSQSSGRYIYLLNPDAHLTDDQTLAKLCREMDNHPEWGMAGTRVVSADGKDESKPATDYPGDRHISRDFSGLPGKITWIIGASMIIRRECYEKLGGFDPAIFLYSEETDLCLRLRESGREIGFLPEITVRHIGGASEDPRDPYDVSARKLRGLLIFRQKHYSPEDCRSLAQRDLRRARFRMLWNGFLAKFAPPNSPAWQKHRLYYGVWKTSRDYLAGELNRAK